MKIKKLTTGLLLVCGTMSVCGAGVCSAQIETSGQNSGDYNGPGPWNTSALSIANVTNGSGLLEIDGSAGAAEVFNTGQGILAASQGSEGTAVVAGNGALWSNTGLLSVGRSGQGFLQIADGGRVTSTNAFVGESNSSSGLVFVEETGSEWINSGYLYVGQSGTGTINVEDGGLVSNTDSYLGYSAFRTGTVNVRSGGQWINTGEMTLGHFGQGIINIETGGMVTTGTATAPEDTIFGYGSGFGTIGAGTANVSGTNSMNSLWTMNGSVTLGRQGTGVLNIGDYGIVTNYNSTLGDLRFTGSGAYIGTGTATVSGTGQWLNDGFQYVGNSGEGTLLVEMGGLVTNSIAIVGREVNSIGAVTVTGPGSEWNNDSYLRIGDNGTGTLNVENGGFVTNTDGLLGQGTTGNGTAIITGAGSHWENTDDLYVGGSAFSQSGTGLLQILDNGLVSVADDLKIWNSGLVQLDGGKLNVDTLDLREGSQYFEMDAGILVADRVRGNLVQAGGVLSVADAAAFAVGSSIGLTVLDNDYTMANAGALLLEIGGLDRGIQFDAIDVGGTTTINGVIDIDFVNGFESMVLAGDEFNLVNGSVAGTYSFDFTDAALNPGLSWFTDDFSTTGTISVFTSIPEPGSTLFLAGLGVAVVAFRRRRKTKDQRFV